MKLKKLVLALTAGALILTQPLAIHGQTQITKDQEYLETVKKYILETYPDPVTEEQLYDEAIKGMFNALDPYSEYLDKEDAEEFYQDLEGTQVGIGIIYSMNQGKPTIMEVLDDSPAKRAGMKIGDVITSVDGNPIAPTDTLEQISKRIKGDQGSSVKISVQRGNQAMEFSLKRDLIKMSPASAKILDNNIGYLRIKEFTPDSYQYVKGYVDMLKGKNVKKMVLDLRGNPGGSVDQVVEIAQLFVPKGKIIDVKYKDGTVTTHMSKGELAFENVVVLVDGGSASASEILAGAIQDRKSGVLVGEKTFGKGRVQNILPLTNGDMVRLTIAKYYLPSGRNIDHVGIEPDYKLVLNPPTNEGIVDNQLKKAIEILGK